MPHTASSRTRKLRSLTLPSALFALAATGCAAEAPPEELVAQEGKVGAITYEEFRERYAVYDRNEDVWFVEWDLRLHGEAELRAYYEDHYAPSGGLTVSRNSSGADDVWSRSNKHNITFCVSRSSFGSSYSAVVVGMLRAASAWENVANVRFIHDSTQDDNCTDTNTAVKFNVRQVPAGRCSAFLPSWVRSKRFLAVDVNVCGDASRAAVGVLMHELGHVLGFRHEHIRTAPIRSACWESEPPFSRAVTAYDPASVMHYQGCPNSTNFGPWFITELDIQGAQALYEAPTNVMDTFDNQLYVRRRSNGALVKRNSNSTFSTVGGTARAFVAAGVDLYLLAGDSTPDAATQVQRYNGSGTSWSLVPSDGTIRRIFKCNFNLCAVKANGTVHRLTGSTWAPIGPTGFVGTRFVSTGGGSIFGLDSFQDTAVGLGTGIGLQDIGGGGFGELVTNEFNLFGIDRDRAGIYRYSGSGTTWSSSLGSPGRQLHGVGDKLYLLVGTTAKEYDGSTFRNIDTATARFYGNYGLYVTDSRNLDDLWSRINGGWWYLGQVP